MRRQLIIFAVSVVCAICLLVSAQFTSRSHLGEDAWTKPINLVSHVSTLVDGPAEGGDDQEPDGEEAPEVELLAAPLNSSKGPLPLNKESRLPTAGQERNKGRDLRTLLFRPPRL